MITVYLVQHMKKTCFLFIFSEVITWLRYMWVFVSIPIEWLSFLLFSLNNMLIYFAFLLFPGALRVCYSFCINKWVCKVWSLALTVWLALSLIFINYDILIDGKLSPTIILSQLWYDSSGSLAHRFVSHISDSMIEFVTVER